MSGFDYEFKFCIVGPSRVGKTTIKIRATDDIFTESYLATIGPEFVDIVRNYDLAKKVIKVTLWDGPGSEKHSNESKRNAIMKNCQGALLVFDLTKRSTFEKIEDYWTTLIEKSPKANVVLVGNKSDLVEQRQVSEEEALQLSSRLCCDLYIEISAKTGAGFPEVINYLERACMSDSNTKNALENTRSGKNFKDMSNRSLADSSKSNENISRAGTVRSKAKSLLSTPTENSRSALGKWYPSVDEREASLEQFKLALKEGIQVLVYPHAGGAPQYATLSIDKHNKRLVWQLESGRFEGLYINDIAEIRPPTENSYTFLQMRIPERCEGKNCLFTVIGSEKVIPMGAKSSDQCKFLVRGLKLITECSISTEIKKMRGKEQWTQGKFMILRGGRLTHAEMAGLDEFKNSLKRGIDVMLLGKKPGKRSPKVLWMDSAETRLMTATHKYDLSEGLSWITALLQLIGSVDEGINIDDISEVRPGYHAYLFNIQDPPPHPREEALALSIISSECTLSMLMTSVHERDLFISHFQGLLKMIRPTVSVY